MDELTYKRLDSQKDVLYSQKTEVEELFYPQQGITRPYTVANNIFIDELSPPAENPDEFNKISYVQNNNSKINYFSFARAEKDNYANGEYTGLMFSYVKSLMYPNSDNYKVEDGNLNFSSVSKFDVLSVTREWYRDGLDPNFFAVFIDTSSKTPTSSAPTSYSTGDDVLGLFPSQQSHQSPLGYKHYLYPTNSSSVLYDDSSDTLTMVGEDDLNKIEPYGEIILDAGIVLLYTDIIDAKYANTNVTDLLHYMSGVIGRSRTQVNSTVYYCRATNSEFNYTTNRTFYRDDAENIVKQEFRDNPTTFITSIGLYNEKNQCIAHGRLSQPVKKDFTRERSIIAEINL